MNRKIILSVAAVVGLAFLIGVTWAQRPVVPRPAPGPQVGRFQVAHSRSFEAGGGTFTHIVILDTVTGKLYKADDDNFKKYSDLPKVEAPAPPPPPPPPATDKAKRKVRVEEEDAPKRKEKPRND